MADDKDMWVDIECLEEDGKTEVSELLLKCFNARYNEYDIELAEELKDEFIEKYGYWGNYY